AELFESLGQCLLQHRQLFINSDADALKRTRCRMDSLSSSIRTCRYRFGKQRCQRICLLEFAGATMALDSIDHTSPRGFFPVVADGLNQIFAAGTLQKLRSGDTGPWVQAHIDRSGCPKRKTT